MRPKTKQYRKRRKVFCPNCGYRGIQPRPFIEPCPECGDPLKLVQE